MLTEALGSRVHLRHHSKSPSSLIWDIQAQSLDGHDAYYKTFSESSNEAWYHTDSSYSPEPKEFFVLWCLHPVGCGGGNNMIVDGGALTSMLLMDNAALQEPVPFRIPDAFRESGDSSYLWAPVLDGRGTWRYRHDTLSTGMRENQESVSQSSRAALEAVERALRKYPQHTVHLERGDALLVANRRALHARTAFSDVSRHLLRARFDRCGYAHRVWPIVSTPASPFFRV